jgi:hypothetical protein
MNATLVRSFLALIPVALLLAWSIGVLSTERTLGPLLAFLGATCLLIVVLTHVAESQHLFAFMHWGDPHSAGHYLDLSSAILAVSLISALMLRGRGRARSEGTR